jgi:hypothetical protein
LKVVAFALLGGVACVINPGSSSHSGSPATAPRVSASEVPSAPGPGTAVYVLAPLGLNIHSAPDSSAPKITTIGQSARLDVTETNKVGSEIWLHVTSQSGQFAGWVLDRPDLVTHQRVSLHVESGAGWSILFPADWSPTSGNPATFTGAPGDTLGSSMLIQTAPDPAQLLATPTTAGKELRQESPIEVYGLTTFLTVYRLDSGGYEYDVKAQFPKSKVAYLFDYKQTRAKDANTTMFKQLLDSVIVPGEG